MTPRAVVVAAAAVVAIAGVLVLVFQGDPYRLRVELRTASGLQEGSPVKVGGVGVGKIGSLDLGHGDKVIAKLNLDDDDVKIDRGTRVRVVTSNLLGSKFIELRPGESGDRSPSGTLLPGNRVSYPVDLDEVVNTLDGDTRGRLQVLIDEAGTGLAGRRTDWNEMLRVLGPTLADADAVVAELTRDNESLARTVQTASGFVSRLSSERRQLSRLVEIAGATMRTTADRRVVLRRTLAEAPGALTQARGFLSDLHSTTEPLGPAARLLAVSGPPLAAALAELPAFQRAADPTLRRAATTAPALTKLSKGATPVLRRAQPTLETTARFAGTLAPVSRTLRVIIDDVLGLAEGWGRAIQTRDRMSHVFRGRAAVGVETFRSAIAQLTRLLAPKAGKRAKTPSRGTSERRPAPQPATPKLPDVPKLPQVPLLNDLKGRLPDVVPQAQELLDDLLPGTRRQSGGSRDTAKPLLDFLLKP